MYATLKYLADLSLYEKEKPYTLHGFPEHVQPSTNCEYEFVKVAVEDVRGEEEQFKLGTSGFEFHVLPSFLEIKSGGLQNQQKLIENYLETTLDSVKEILGASKAVCFDWRVRKSGGSSTAGDQLENVENARYTALAPAALMHCDYSYDGGLDILELHLSSRELQAVRSGEWRAKIINVWRPLSTVQHTPLILCDRRTVRASDVVEVDQVAPTRVELSMSLKFHQEQKYYWMSKQTQDEVVLFTSWDSKPEGLTSDHTPHGAFLDISQPINMAPRESVEVRLIVLWEDNQGL